MSRTNYLLKNTVIFAIGSMGSKLISFLLVPLYTNMLSTNDYGTVDLIFTISSFAVPLMILNINESIMRFSLDKDSNKYKIMTAGLFIIVLSLFSSLILAIISNTYKPTEGYSLYIYLYIIAIGINTVFSSYLRGRELLLHFVINNIIQTALVAIFNVIFLLFFNMGIKGFLLAYIIANLVASIYSFFTGKIKEIILNLSIDLGLWKEMTKYSVILIPNSFLWWIINSSNRIIITDLLGIGASGIFAIATKIPSFISVLSNIFNNAFSYSAIKEKDSVDRAKYINKIFEYLLSLVTLAGILILFALKPFMHIYVGEDFNESWKYVSPLIIGACIMVLATFLSSSYIVYKDSLGFLISASLGAFTSVILNYTLIPLIGLMGASLATLVCNIIVFTFRYFHTTKYINIKVFSKKNAVCIFLLFISGYIPYATPIASYIIAIISLFIVTILYGNNWILLLRNLITSIKKKQL